MSSALLIVQAVAPLVFSPAPRAHTTPDPSTLCSTMPEIEILEEASDESLRERDASRCSSGLFADDPSCQLHRPDALPSGSAPDLSTRPVLSGPGSSEGMVPPGRYGLALWHVSDGVREGYDRDIDPPPRG